MRAKGQDIVELFGFAPNDPSAIAKQQFERTDCPFVKGQCGKTNHNKTLIYGTCSVTAGREKREVIICPKRLYADKYRVLSDAANAVWGNIALVAGGAISELREQALTFDECAIAFGQNSGREVTINSNGKLSLDWVIQRYKRINGKLVAQDYIGIEVQSIDITGNYRDNWQAYRDIKFGSRPNVVPDSGHGLNWANVHKRLIPQIIRKGNVYSFTKRCSAFFFILPDLVYEKFEQILGDIPEQNAPSNQNLSVLTYGFGPVSNDGEHRNLVLHRTKHHSLSDIAHAFITNCGDTVSDELDEMLQTFV
jgi:hypothetical protein